MSFRVLVVPEDPTNNGYILKPLIQRIVADAGRPNARVTVLSNPRVQGYDHAQRALREDLPQRYAHMDLWIFIPDADRGTPVAMQGLEEDLSRRNIKLLCCSAQPELEIYACVAYRDEIESWESARVDGRFKENIFSPLLERHGDNRRAGGGRDLMIDRSLANLRTLYQFCPELKGLRDRIAEALR